MRWSGATVVILASGPSLTQDDAVHARFAVDYVIAVNESWRVLPPTTRMAADVLYAADVSWWKHRAPKAEQFTGERWTQDKHWTPRDAEARGINVIRSEHGHGVAHPGADFIYTGFNSGFQALNLAVVWGAKRVVLLGFDMGVSNGRNHWHEDYSGGELRNAAPDVYNGFRNAFVKCAPKFAELGVEVINASRETTLKCFPRMTIQEALP